MPYNMHYELLQFIFHNGALLPLCAAGTEEVNMEETFHTWLQMARKLVMKMISVLLKFEM
jgi:hypothetical protein